MDQMAVDIEEGVAVGPIDDDVAPPDLLEHRGWPGRIPDVLGLSHAVFLRGAARSGQRSAARVRIVDFSI
jgi:hypothetical protein